MKSKITVLIIEDSALMRRELSAIINSDPGLKVIGVAVDGADGLRKVKELQPDVVTIDLNMPLMDGLTCLQYIMIESPRPCVIISVHAGRDKLETFEALELGAVDFVEKPSGEISRDIGTQARKIIRCVKGAAIVNFGNLARRLKLPSAVPRKVSTTRENLPDSCVVVGVSTGGPRALIQIASELPAELGAPVLIIQHMPENFTTSFADRLNRGCELPVREAQAGEELQNNEVYVAPGGSHLTFEKRSGEIEINIRRAAKTDIISPSVDIAMNSAIDIFADRTVGVILTGMGHDGAQAMARLHRLGGLTIAEAQETAIIFGMPKEVIELGAAKIIAPLDNIAKAIVTAVKDL